MNKGQIRRNIKSLAKRMLKGGWGLALLVLLVPTLLSAGFVALDKMVIIGLGYPPDIPIEILSDDLRYAAMSLALAIASFFLATPLTFGVRDWYVELGAGNKESLGYIFNWFSTVKKFGRTIGVALLVGIKTFLWTMLFIIPLVFATAGVIFIGWIPFTFDQFRMYMYDRELILMILQTIIPQIIACISVYIIWGLAVSIWLMRYAAAPYILINNPEKGIRECIAESVRMMKGHCTEYFMFNLSFLGWILLSPLTFFLMLLWLIPYMMQSTALFFKYIEDAYFMPGFDSPYNQIKLTEESNNNE